MNIFVTDNCPVKSARYLDDKRVIKMISESCQMLATALHHHGIKDVPIKSTHVNHPANVWARSTQQNYKWLLRHAIALMHEKRRRYPENKHHQYEQHINYFRENAKHLPNFVQTPFVNCAANQELNIDYKHISDVNLAYQLYLNDRWDNDKRTPTWYRVSRM